MTNLTDKIENIRAGFRSYGYRIISEPVPGQEQEWYSELRDGLNKLDVEAEAIHERAHCFALNERTLRILHTTLPQPCWGVEL